MSGKMTREEFNADSFIYMPFSMYEAQSFPRVK